MKSYLKEMLNNYEIDGKGKEAYAAFQIKKTIMHVRDYLSKEGNILVEDRDAGLYIATISAGTKNLNYAIVVVKLEQQLLHVYAVAKEGLFNQHTSEKAIERIKAEFVYE